MPVPNGNRAGAGSGGVDDDDSDRRRCSCLPFCFWRGASSGGSNKSAGAPASKSGRRRRRRLRLSWLITWPWFGKKKGGAGGGNSKNEGRKRTRGRRLLLLLTASLQPKKALESVVSGDGALLPAKAKVSSLGDDARKKSNRKPRPTVHDGPSGSGQPQASTTASTGWGTAAPVPPHSRTTEAARQPSPRATDGSPGVAGRRIWRAPSRRQRHPSFHGSGGAGGLWTAATTLGVIVFFGRVTAVVFLCSCLYGARFVRELVGVAGGGGGGSTKAAKFKNSGRAGGSTGSSRRSGDPVGVVAAGEVVVEPCASGECKKKAVMAGLLDRAGKTPSSRFGR